MAASVNDYFKKLGSASSLINSPKVTATRSGGGTTLTVDNCNWDTTTGKVFATYQVDTSNNVVANTQTIWVGVVNSSTSIGSLSRVAGASDTGNAIGDIVELLPASKWANDLMTGLLVEHNQDGTHGAVTATSVTTSGAVLTTPKVITSINDTNGNELAKVTATASAVNEITVANAATGNAPQISSTGDDSNIDLRLTPKGTGNIKRGATGGSIDWWEELGRTTLSGAADTISVASLPARKYLKILVSLLDTGGTIYVSMRFNNDSGANYAVRTSVNGAADGTATSATSLQFGGSTSANPNFLELNVINILAAEKLVVGQIIDRGAAGAGTGPTKAELTGKWANTAAQISRVDLVNTGAGDYAIGSEVVVLGHD